MSIFGKNGQSNLVLVLVLVVESYKVLILSMNAHFGVIFMKIVWRTAKQAVRIMNDVPFEDHITPRYAKPWFIEISISLVSEEHNYSTRSGIFSTFFSSPFKAIREFCPTVIGKYYWNELPLAIRTLSAKILLKNATFKYYFVQYWFPCLLLCVFGVLVRVCVCMYMCL